LESISKSAVVPFTVDQMYTLVNDVESYPIFLPWCSDGVIHEQEDHYMKASVSLAVGAIKQTFTTENTLDPGKRIDVQLVSGPFKQLHGYWVFESAGEGRCQIIFQMNFEYKNTLVKLALNKVFQRIGDMMVAGFIERAKVLYAGK
jgi:ribosome-associated toxin RatA of RatAB toxin-antitoxin module